MIEPHHIELLRVSAIPVPLAERAGVRSLCGADTSDEGFGEKAGPGYVVHPGDVRLPLAPNVAALPFSEL